MKLQWVRLVLAISLDGRLAFTKGGTSPLGGEGDRKVLEEALRWSDATLMGAGTLRVHRNTCLIHNEELIQSRLSEGRSKQPITVVVSKKEEFCYDWPFFQQPIQRWLLSKAKIISNCDATSTVYARRLELKEKWSETLFELQKEGLNRLVVLGGAHLAGSLLQADQIDELQLTLTSRILGGPQTWIPTEMNHLPMKLWQSNAWNLKEHEPLGENELKLRYFRNRDS